MFDMLNGQDDICFIICFSTCVIFLCLIMYVQAENTVEKITDLVSEMLLAINMRCQNCQFSSSHFGNLQFICEQTKIKSNFSSLQGTVVGSSNTSPTEIIDLLQQWVDTSPVVLIGGAWYRITAQCMVLIDSIGISLCTTASEVSSAENETGDSSLSVLATTALVISIVDMALMAFGIIGFTIIHIRGRYVNEVSKVVLHCIVLTILCLLSWLIMNI